MRCNIRPILICLAQAFAMPVCAQVAPQHCYTATAQAAAASCIDAAAGTWAHYPFHAWFDPSPDQSMELAVAAIMIGVLALRVRMR